MRNPPRQSNARARHASVTTTILAAVTVALLPVSSCLLPAAAVGEPARVTWRGDVDGEIELLIREREVKVHKVSGKSVEHAQYLFRSPLPKKAVAVRVDKRQGRGKVTIFQQPAASNKYTAGVRITDGAGGRAPYRVVIRW
ncbi:MAG: hypothetical protein H7Z41_13075 [Cytophagales bacterium]|nr:hypothetical protein [Armatimonadota bacterium]